MPFDVRTDFVKVTGDTVLVPITIQMKYRDITFANKDGVQRGTVNIFGRITTLSGRVVQTFEDPAQIDVPAELLAQDGGKLLRLLEGVPLRPGRYKFDIAVKDVNGDRKGVWSRGIQVPEYSDDKLCNVIPDRGRRYGTGAYQRCQHGQLCDRIELRCGRAWLRPTASRQSLNDRSEGKLLDPGL